MKKQRKKLVLAKETVRSLTDVKGGGYVTESHTITCENSAYVDCPMGHDSKAPSCTVVGP